MKVIFFFLITFFISFPGISHAQFYVVNATGQPIVVAFAAHRTYSDWEGWEGEGWWIIQPGESATVFGKSLWKSTYYVHAHVADNMRTAKSDYQFLVHPKNAFKIDHANRASVKEANPEYEWRDFWKVDVGSSLSYTYTVKFEDVCVSGDCSNGYGEYYFINASKYYKGYFKGGKRHGQGRAWYTKYHKKYAGCSYEGEWANDNYYGKGTFTNSDGSYFTGYWKEELRHGEGAEYTASGNLIRSGRWENDVYVGPTITAQPPQISWKIPSTSTIEVTEPTYTISACIKTTAAISDIQVYVNGALSGSRAPEVVKNDGCDVSVRRTLALEAGRNTIYIKATSKDGAAQSETVTVYYKKGNTPKPINNPASNSKRLALLVGNADYENCTALRNPINDVNSMKTTLEQLGFKVLKYENLNLPNLKRAIDNFGTQLRNYDLGMVFFSGHGIQVNGINYLVPIDAKLTYEQEVDYECVNAGSILAKMEGAASKVNVVVLDACRSNPFEKGWTRSTKSTGLAAMSAPTGTLLAYATSPNNVASDGQGTHGLYTAALLEALQIPNLTLEEVFKQVRIRVLKNSNNSQVPWESSSLTGNIILNPR